MKIVIPTQDNKLCSHFGHCEIFSFAEVNPETREIIEISTGAPEEGVSCQSAGWLATQGVNIALVGGIGGRPLAMLAQNGIDVITGCPELEIKEVVELFLENRLVTGENACGHDENHKCGHHENSHHHCGNHN